MTQIKPPITFWVIAIIGLIWNLMGCWNYILQTNPSVVAQMPELYRFVVENRPSWATAGFAVSVFAGATGAILLLLRRRVALPVFIISMLGTIVIFYFTFRVLGLDATTFSALLMSAALTGFAVVSQQRKWIT